jgi:hypothetical protein
MQHLINIYVTAWEWLEDRRGRTEALRLQGETETKSIWTFLSQGAVGGAVGYFLLFAGYASFHPPNPYLLYGAIFFMTPGAFMGAFISVLVWLASHISRRRLNVLQRTILIAGVATLLGVAFSFFNPSVREQWSPLETIGMSVVFCAPIVLIAGSRIRPGHLIVLGVEQRNKRYNLGDWLAYPVGFVLRIASILGLFQAVLVLAMWVSAGPNDLLGDPASGDVGAIIVAVLYFFLSSYFSIATPRKALVVPTAMLVNLPLVVLLAYVKQVNSDAAQYLLYALLWFLWLWGFYTVGRLIAPEADSAVVAEPQKYGVVKRPLPRKNCTVML